MKNQMEEKMKSELPIIRYTCPKCGGRKYSVSEIRVDHSLFTQLFNLLATKYSAIVCEKCKYTEFYKVPLNKINTVFDSYVGG